MSSYHREDGIPDGMMEVHIERGGEYLQAYVPEGATIKALITDGHLRGINVASTRVNGSPAEDETILENGDSVSQVPRSGKQG